MEEKDPLGLFTKPSNDKSSKVNTQDPLGLFEQKKNESYELGFQKAERERKETPTQIPLKTAEQQYKEQPIASSQPKPKEGSYANIPAQILEGASAISLKPLAMVSDMLLSASKEILPNQLHGGLETVLGYPKEAVARYEQNATENQLPDTVLGNVTTGVAKIAPMVAALYTGNATPALEQAPSVLNLVNNTVMSPLTKFLATEKTSSAYLKADKEGKGTAEKMAAIPEGVLEGVKEGFALAGYGGLANRLTKGQMASMAEKGLISGTGKVQEKVLTALNMGSVFGASSAVDDVLQGHDIDEKKVLTNFGIGIALEAPHVFGAIKETTGENVKEFMANRAIVKAAKDGLGDKNAIINFAQTPLEAIHQVNSMKETHQDLFKNSLDKGIEAVNQKDINKKKELFVAQILAQKASDVKYVSDLIKNDYDGFADAVNKMDIPLEAKAELMDKANQIKANEGSAPTVDGYTGQVSDTTVKPTNGEVKTTEPNQQEKVDYDKVDQDLTKQLKDSKKELKQFVKGTDGYKEVSNKITELEKSIAENLKAKEGAEGEVKIDGEVKQEGKVVIDGEQKEVVNEEGKIEVENELPKELDKDVWDKVFDHTESKAVIDFLEGLKFKTPTSNAGKTFAKVLPVKEVYNFAVDIVINAVRAGNSMYNAVKLAKDYLKEQGHSSDEIKGFDRDMQEKMKGYSPKPKKTIKQRISEATDTRNKKKVVMTELGALKKQIKDFYRGAAQGKKEGIREERIKSKAKLKELNDQKREAFLEYDRYKTEQAKAKLEAVKAKYKEALKDYKEGQSIKLELAKDIKDAIDEVLKEAKEQGVIREDMSKKQLLTFANKLKQAGDNPVKLLKALEYLEKSIQHATTKIPIKIGEKTPLQGTTPDVGKILKANEIIADQAKLEASKKFKDRVNNFIRKTSESQILVLKALRKADPSGFAEASFRTKLGYTNKAAEFTQTVGDAIFSGLSTKDNIDFGGVKTSEYQLLNTSITMKRIIAIDEMLEVKKNEFNELRKKIYQETIKPKAQQDLGKAKDWEQRREEIQKYLTKQEVLKYNPNTREFEFLQFKHPNEFNGKSAQDALDLLKKDHPETYKKIEDRIDKYDKAQKQLTKDKLDAGLISQEQYDALTGTFYAPRRFSEYLIDEQIAALTDSGNPNSPLRKLNTGIKALSGGSTDLISTNYQELLNVSALSTYKNIYEQRSVLDIKELIGKNGDTTFQDAPIEQVTRGGVTKDKTDSFGNPVYKEAPKGYDFIDYFEGGKKHKFLAPKDFVTEYYHQNQPSPVLRAIGRATLVNVFKGAITGYNPTFGVFQLFVDAPSAIMVSRAYGDAIYGTAVFTKNMPASFKSAFTKDALFKEASEFGAFTDLVSDYGDVLGLKSKSNTRNVAEAIMKKSALFNEAMEYTTRINVYKTMRDKLVSDYVSKNKTQPTGEELRQIKVLAAGEARAVIDFSRGGTYAKELNHVIPYLNPAIQGARAAFESATKNPYRLAAKVGEVMAVNTLLLAYSLGDLLGSDEDEKKKRLDSYLQLNDYQRQNYINIWNPLPHDEKENDWIKITKVPFLRGILNTVEQFYLAKYKGQEVDMGNMATAYSQISPYDMGMLTSNPVMNATIKYGFNTDPYTKKKIVRNEEQTFDYLEGVDDSSISTIYKKGGDLTHRAGLGEGLSPKRTKATVESFIGNPSRNFWMSMGDKLVLAPLAYIAGQEDALDYLKGGALSTIGKATGASSRLFNKVPDIDPRIFKALTEKAKEKNKDKLYLDMEISDLVSRNKEINDQKEAVTDLLDEKVDNKEIDKDDKKRILKAYFEAPELKDAPNWYKVIKYGGSNDDKADLIKAFIKSEKLDKNQTLIDLKKRKVISTDLYKKIKNSKEEPEEKEEE